MAKDGIVRDMMPGGEEMVVRVMSLPEVTVFLNDSRMSCSVLNERTILQ